MSRRSSLLRRWASSRATGARSARRSRRLRAISLAAPGAEEGIDPEQHDQGLWDGLGEIQVPDAGGKVAVADLIADGVWH